MLHLLKKWCCLVLSISMTVSTIAPTWAVKVQHLDPISQLPDASNLRLKEHCESNRIRELLTEKPLSQPLSNDTDSASENPKLSKAAFGHSSNPLLSFMTFACAHPLQALMFLFLMQESFFKSSPLVKVPGVAADLSVSGLNQNLTSDGLIVHFNPIVVSDPTIPFYIKAHYNVTFVLSDIMAGNLTSNATSSLKPSFLNGIWNVYSELIPLNDLLFSMLLISTQKLKTPVSISGMVNNIDSQQIVSGSILIDSLDISTQTSSMTTVASAPTPLSSTTSASKINVSSTSQSSGGVMTTMKVGGTNQNPTSSIDNSSKMLPSSGPLSDGFSAINSSLETSRSSNSLLLPNPSVMTTNSLLYIMNSPQDKSAMIIGASVGGCVILTGAMVALIVGYKRQWCGLNSSAKQSQVQDKALESGQSKQYASLGLYHNLPQSAAGQSDTTNYSKPPAPDSMDQSQGALYTKAPIAPAGSPQGNGLYTNAPLAPANAPVSGQNNYIACDAPLMSSDSSATNNSYGRLSKVEVAYVECDAPLE